MTGQDIYVLASAILFEGDNEDTDAKKFTVQFLNHLLFEALAAENGLRLRDGQTALDKPPLLKGIEETVPYHDRLCRTALVYGLCWHFFENMQNTYESELYRKLFVSSLEDSMTGAWEAVCGL